MNKSLLLLLLPLFSLGTLSASAQKVPDKIDQAAKDPTRAENEAKADVYIHKKNRPLIDSAQQAPQQAATSIKKKKSRKCSKH